MKKLVSVLFALLLVGSFAFAQDAMEEPAASVTVGGWGRFIFAPMGSIDGEDSVAFSGPSWASGSRVGVAINGTSENVGFSVQYYANGNVLGLGENANVWVKFSDMVTLYGGMKQGNTLRGKIGDSDIFNAMPSIDLTPDNDDDSNALLIAVGATGEDDIFERFYPKLGVLLEVTPAEGVYIGVELDTNGSGLAGDDFAVTAVTTEDMFKKVQVGAGYVIPNIGHLRAQYIGNVDSIEVEGVDVDQPKYFNVAFAYTGMENLLVDAGLKYQMTADVGQSLFTVAGTYAMDALSFLARAQVGFGEDAAGDELSYKASGGVGYTVADPLSVGAEVSFAKREDAMGFSVGPYGLLGYGNGSFRAAFVFSSFTDYPYIDQDTGVLGADSYTAWALPLILTYSF